MSAFVEGDLRISDRLRGEIQALRLSLQRIQLGLVRAAQRNLGLSEVDRR